MSRRSWTPPISDATSPYWEATRSRELLLQRCARCGQFIHHPREACPTCLSRELTWQTSTGSGVVHASSIHRRPFPPMDAEDCPYVVAFVDLDEGVRFLANVVDVEPEHVCRGMRVRLTWTLVADGYHLPQFTPEAS